MRITVWGLILLMFSGACGQAASDERPLSERPVRVVATTSIVADLVLNVGGPRVEVDALMGPGVDPHLFNASAGDVTVMAAADVVVYNGLHLEGKMGDLFEQMNERGKLTIPLAELAVPDSLLLPSELFQSNYDPHIWFDVGLWRLAAQTLANELARLDTVHAETYQSRAIDYSMQLQEAEDYVHSRISEIPASARVLVTSHDAFGYFGTAFGFEVHGLQGLTTAVEAGTADVQALAELVAERRIPSMFIESSVSPRGIEAVREAVRARGFEIGLGGPLHGDALGAPGSPASTYVGMVRHNIEVLVEGLTDGARS